MINRDQARALLEDPDDFGTFGRFTETPVDQMPPQMRAAFDFTRELRGLVPGPHKIWAANPELLKTIAPTGAYYQAKSTLSKAEIEIATCVICGHWGRRTAVTSTRRSAWPSAALGRRRPRR